MAGTKRTFWEAKPRKPIRHGLSARVVDWWVSRFDGMNGVPQLPSIRLEELPAPQSAPAGPTVSILPDGEGGDPPTSSAKLSIVLLPDAAERPPR
jgi:hypothetical protein